MLPDIDILLKPRPRKFKNIAKHLSPLLLAAGRDFSFSDEDIFRDLSSHRGTNHLLGVYSREGVTIAYERFGVFRALKNRGLPESRIQIDTSDPFRHTLQVFHKSGDNPSLSVEVILRQGDFPFSGESGVRTKHAFSLNLLIVEWFLLQNPKKAFSKKRPQLPGQHHPGLGLSTLGFEMLYWTARHLHLDGVILVPNYLHTGIFYGRQFLFIDPEKQGTLHAIQNMVSSKCTLDQLSWSCAEGQLIDQTNDTIFHWIPAPMVLPVSRQFKAYFNQSDFKHRLKYTQKTTRFRINKGYKKSYDKQWKAI